MRWDDTLEDLVVEDLVMDGWIKRSPNFLPARFFQLKWLDTYSGRLMFQGWIYVDGDADGREGMRGPMGWLPR